MQIRGFCTGIKNQNIKSMSELFKSFSSIKSPNNIKYRYILFKKVFWKLRSFFYHNEHVIKHCCKIYVLKII